MGAGKKEKLLTSWGKTPILRTEGCKLQMKGTQNWGTGFVKVTPLGIFKSGSKGKRLVLKLLQGDRSRA